QLSFEIPTLAQAEYIINALNKLRQIVDTEGMDNTDINQKYSGAVALACDRHFADLIPQREGRDNLYTHLFRSVYAAIATHWYCPPRVADIEFKAAIQGHFIVLDQTNPERRRSLAASRHYSDYKMGDGKGNIDGRQGIKLGQPGKEVIEMFKDKSSQNGKGTKSAASMAKRSRSLLQVFADERDRWLAVLNQAAPQEPHQIEKTSVLLNWIEQQLEAAQAPIEADKSGVGRPISVEAVSAPAEAPGAALPVIDNLASGIAFLTAELQAAKAHSTELERQRDQSKVEATGYQQQVTQLQQANAQLQAELAQFRQAQVQLEPLLKLLQGAHSPVQTTPTPALSQLIAQPSIPTAIATAPAQIAAPVATAPPAAAQAASAPVAIAAAPTAPKRTRRSGGMTEAKVNLIIDAILAYNDTPGLSHTDKWGISFPVVKELGKPIGATYQKAIKQVFEDRQAEIEAHHQRHGLGSRHNRGKDLSQLPQLIHIKDPAAL
ncbi:MAG: protelomerase family protein, partial [Leptolyngbyaceae cyanobacterium MO_188.B28]|nr:protelomerase family protein [Leptolyngbyaceae cyanobacterium MO_188.B28]